MDIGSVDYWATSGRSLYHSASAPSKLVSSLLVVAAAMLTRDVVILTAIYLAEVSAVVAARLPVRQVMALGAYPAIFSILFVISQWDGTLVRPAIIILRAMDSALAMLLLITTTPYPQVFATLRFVLPRVILDGLFLTYRSLFLLLDVAGDLLVALRVRGGLVKGNPVRSVANIAYGLGPLLLRAMALSQRFYDAMRLRGYTGQFVSGRDWYRLRRADTLPVGLGLALLTIGLASNLTGVGLSGYNGYILLVSALAVAASSWFRARAIGDPISETPPWQMKK